MERPPMGERGNHFYKLLDRYLGIPLSFPAALLRKLEKHPVQPSATSKIGILCFGAIGDLLLLTGLINGIRKKLPQSHIEIIASQFNAQVVPLLPDIDSAKVFPIKKVLTMAFFIRKQRYDLLFDSTQWARISNLLSNFSNAGATIGFKTKGQYRSLGYDYIVRHRDDLHEVENFLNLGKAIWEDFQGAPHLLLTETSSQNIRMEGDSSGQKIIFCHMGCAPGRLCELKQWPESHWAQLINNLLELGFQVHLTGSKSEYEKLDNFMQKYALSNAGVLNLAGKTTLTKLAELYSKSSAVISVNTGPMHVAALAGAKVVVLNGPTRPERWGAWSKASISLVPSQGEYGYINLGFEYPANPKPCMQYISVEAVMEALEKLDVFTAR